MSNILPDDMTMRRDLEEATGSALADQCVTVGQPLRTTDVVAVEGDGWCAAVLPGDGIRRGVHLENSGVVDSPSVGSIVEEEYAATFREVGGMMLVRDLARPPLPCEAAASLVYNANHAGLTEADQEVAVGHQAQGILMRPLSSAFKRANNVFLHAEILPGVPLIDDLPSGVTSWTRSPIICSGSLAEVKPPRTCLVTSAGRGSNNTARVLHTVLVVTMLGNEMRRIYTFSVRDFASFPELEVLRPTAPYRILILHLLWGFVRNLVILALSNRPQPVPQPSPSGTPLRPPLPRPAACVQHQGRSAGWRRGHGVAAGGGCWGGNRGRQKAV
jgi:hypothetical protein